MSIVATTRAIVSLIQGTALKAKLREVAELPGRLTDDVLARFVTTNPSVYVAFVGGRSPRQAATDAAINATWAIYIVTDREDDPRVMGPDDIIDVVIPLLHNRTLTDIGTLQCTQVDNLFSIKKDKKGARIHAVTFAIPNFTFPYQVDLATLNNFVTLDAVHDIDTSQTGEPAAQDTVTLPQ